MPAAATTKPSGAVRWGLGAGGLSPALPLSCCMASDRPLKLSVLQFPNWPNGEKSFLAILPEMVKSNSSAEMFGKM